MENNPEYEGIGFTNFFIYFIFPMLMLEFYVRYYLKIEDITLNTISSEQFFAAMIFYALFISLIGRCFRQIVENKKRIAELEEAMQKFKERYPE